jgi:PAS domain S-box-containing protein
MKAEELFSQAPVGITIFRGPEFVVEMANETYLAIVDRSADYFVGKPLFDVLPEVRTAVEPLLNDVYWKGIPYYGTEFEVVLNRHGKREMTYFNFVYQPLREGELVTGIIVVANEVTSQVQARKAVEEAEERARLATEASLAGVFDIELPSTRTNCSQRFYDIMDLPPGSSHEVIVKRVHPDDMAVRDRAWIDSFVTGVLFYEIRIVVSDGAVRWVRAQGRLYKDKTGKPVRMLGTIIDNTDAVMAEEALKTSERKFRLLSNALPQLIWTADADGTPNYYSESLFAYTGFPPKELGGPGWLEFIHPADRADNMRFWEESTRTGRPFLLEHRLRRHDGIYRWMLSRAVAQRDDDGNIVMWVGTSTDINDQKLFSEELEKKVRERTAQLEAANQELALRNQELLSFNYISSHDLQEPLRKIQTFASRIISTEDALSPDNREYFERIRKSANQMRMLIRDLLEYSRAGEGERQFEEVDLVEMIQTIKQQLIEEADRGRLEIVVRKMPVIRGIPFQISQLFTNLLSNAAKFSRKKEYPVVGVEGYLLAVGADNRPAFLPADGAFQVIEVRDNGIGFSPEYKEHIFEVFRRLHHRSEYEGTGVGLAICKRIVENHGGFITADGQPGEGAVFTVYLPA